MEIVPKLEPPEDMLSELEFFAKSPSRIIKTEVPEITECSSAAGCYGNDGHFKSQRSPPAICYRDIPEISENDRQTEQDIVEITECQMNDYNSKQPSCLPVACKKEVPESLDCGDHILSISECPTDDTDNLLKPLNCLSAKSNLKITGISEHEIKQEISSIPESQSYHKQTPDRRRKCPNTQIHASEIKVLGDSDMSNLPEIIPEIYESDGISYTRQILSNGTADLADVREEGTQSCPICLQVFFDANEYEKHYSYFPFTLDIYLCHNCGGHFLDFTSFQSHTEIRKSKCSKSRYQPTISSHVIISHLRRLWFLCEKCGSHFSPDRELIRHLDSTSCGVLVKNSDPQQSYKLVASNDKDVFLFRMESVMKQPIFGQKLEVYRAESSVSDEESWRSSTPASNTGPQSLQAARCRYFKFPVRDGTQRKVNENGTKSVKRKMETRQTTDPKRPRIIKTMTNSRLNQRYIGTKTKSRLNERDRVKARRWLKRSVADNTRRHLVNNVVQSKINRLLKRERAIAQQPPHDKLINRKRQGTGTVRCQFAPMSNNISVIILGVSTEKIQEPITDNEIQHPENMKQLQEDPVKEESLEQTGPSKSLVKEKSLEQTWPPNIVVILDMPSKEEVYLSAPKDSIEHFNAMTVNFEVESLAGFYCRRCDKSFSTLNAFMAHDECKIDAEKRFALLKRDQLEMICRICGLKFLVCHFCGKHLSSLKDFKMHVKLHRHGEAFDCTVCRKKLLSHLTPHFAKHHKQTASVCKFCDVFNPMKMSKWLHNASNADANFENYPCLCTECSKFVASQSAYDSHQKCCHSKQKSDRTKYFCDICNTDFVDPQALCNHIQNHEQEKKNICEICLRGFLRSATLATHKAKEHGIPIEEEKPNTCETCGITFVSKDYLRIHLSEPHALLYCKKCHRGFKTITTLSYHNTHGCKKKPYKCEKCRKRFTTELTLYLHSIKHKELMKELQCKKCGKCFVFQKTLSHHKKMCRIPLACQKCAEVFLSKELLNLHKKKCDYITLPETKFSCAECSLEFYTWNVYELHTNNIHERQVPDSCRMIQCDSCPEKFAFEASYGMHLRRHKSEGTFVKGPGKCEDCSHRYNSILNKMKHVCPWECPDCGEKVLAQKRRRQNAIDRHKAKHNSSERGTEMTNAEGLEHGHDGVADGNQGAVVNPVPKESLPPILGSDKDKVNAGECTNTDNDSVQAVPDVMEQQTGLTTEEKEGYADKDVAPCLGVLAPDALERAAESSCSTVNKTDETSLACISKTAISTSDGKGGNAGTNAVLSLEEPQPKLLEKDADPADMKMTTEFGAKTNNTSKVVVEENKRSQFHFGTRSDDQFAAIVSAKKEIRHVFTSVVAKTDGLQPAKIADKSSSEPTKDKNPVLEEQDEQVATLEVDDSAKPFSVTTENYKHTESAFGKDVEENNAFNVSTDINYNVTMCLDEATGMLVPYEEVCGDDNPVEIDTVNSSSHPEINVQLLLEEESSSICADETSIQGTTGRVAGDQTSIEEPCLENLIGKTVTAACNDHGKGIPGNAVSIPALL